MAGGADVLGALEDRLALGEAGGVGQRHGRRRGLSHRPTGSGGRFGGEHLGFVLGDHSGLAEHGLRQQVIVDDIDKGERDREVEAVEPPARQGIVELANAVGLVVEQLVTFRS